MERKSEYSKAIEGILTPGRKSNVDSIGDWGVDNAVEAAACPSVQSVRPSVRCPSNHPAVRPDGLLGPPKNNKICTLSTAECENANAALTFAFVNAIADHISLRSPAICAPFALFFFFNLLPLFLLSCGVRPHTECVCVCVCAHITKLSFNYNLHTICIE